MPVYLMFHKPAEYLSAVRDAQKPTVMEFFPPELRERIHPVGRLDYMTRGLLLFTDDSRVDRALLLPERHVVKKYAFSAIGVMTVEKIARLETGVIIGSSGVVSRPAKFTMGSICTVRDIRDDLPSFRKNDYLKNPEGPAFHGTLEVTEGRKHEVRLMLRAVDCRIMRLTRVEMAGIRLDPDLPEGKYRPLNAAEMAILESQIADVPLSVTQLQKLRREAGKRKSEL